MSLKKISLSKKQTVKTLLLSLALLFLSVMSVNACIGPEEQFHLLLDKAPKKLFDAKFMGRVEITQTARDMESGMHIAIATLLESKTHQQYEGQKILFLYYTSSCGPYVRVGDKGYAIGNSTIIDAGGFPINLLAVDPYKIQGVGEEDLLTRELMQEILRSQSSGWGIRGIYTDEEVIPLWKFYFDDLDLDGDSNTSSL